MLPKERSCNKCGKSKPVTSEHWQKIPNSSDGFRKTCLACKSLSDRTRYLKDKNKKIVQAKNWYKANTTKKQKYDSEYRRKHNEEIRKHKKDSYITASERPTGIRLHANLRHSSYRFPKAKRYKLEKRDIFRMLIRQANSCFYCFEKFADNDLITFDHVVPRVRGGSHSIGNLVASCFTCNTIKSHRFIMEYRLNKVVNRVMYKELDKQNKTK
jgi:5-methylcytosine-specific restriction endonuclease McrA